MEERQKVRKLGLSMNNGNLLNSALPKNTQQVIENVEKFRKHELRKILYEISRNYRKNKEIKKAIKILLVGWNWRAYAGADVSNNDLNRQIEKFLKVNRELHQFLKKSDASLKNINFEERIHGKKIRTWIANGFDNLRKEDAIGSTGASKVFHIFFPEVFMMWDRKIIKNYHNKSSKLHWRKHKKGSGHCYSIFLMESQKFINSRLDLKEFEKQVERREYENPSKIMDEYNYGRFTL